jgi:hypothetical protein
VRFRTVTKREIVATQWWLAVCVGRRWEIGGPIEAVVCSKTWPSTREGEHNTRFMVVSQLKIFLLFRDMRYRGKVGYLKCKIRLQRDTCSFSETSISFHRLSPNEMRFAHFLIYDIDIRLRR